MCLLCDGCFTLFKLASAPAPRVLQCLEFAGHCCTLFLLAPQVSLCLSPGILGLVLRSMDSSLTLLESQLLILHAQQRSTCSRVQLTCQLQRACVTW